MMLYADGELNAADEKDLMAFINAHPELKKELAAYGRTRLVADDTQVYEHKSTLLKPQPAKRISLVQWSRYGMAAGIAAVIILSVLKLSQQGRKAETVATKTPTTRPKNAEPMEHKASSATKDTNAVNLRAIATATSPKSPAAVQHKPLIAAKTQPAVKKKAEPVTGQQLASREKDNVDRMPVVVPMPVPARHDTSARTIEIPSVAFVVTEGEQDKTSLLDKLPIEDTKKEGLETAAGAISNVYQKAVTVKDNILGKNFSVKVEKRKLTISF